MDNLAKFLIWMLGVYGTTNIIVFSTLFKPLRQKLSSVKFIGKMISCILCMGFWVGLFWGLTFWSPASILNANFLYPLFDGCIGSCLSWLIYLSVAESMTGK